MSLPNYLAKIKSAGIYRFVWDKSEIPPQEVGTLRLVVGYSEKGPFNTPVYIENANDFKTIFGNISKRLERKGVYFHRLAMQALSAGPILALNLKPFNVGDPKDENGMSPMEQVSFINSNAGVFHQYSKTADLDEEGNPTDEQKIKPYVGLLNVTDLYDTNRFWALDPDQLPARLEKDDDGIPGDALSYHEKGYFTITSTDVKENSCTIFMRKYVPDSYKGITVESWYKMQALEMPDYLEKIKTEDIDQFFAELYVFRGDLTSESLFNGENAPLKDYLNYVGNDVAVNTEYEEFGEKADALDAMTRHSLSNFLSVYSGCLLPYFKDANNNYIALDLLFNSDNSKHKMIMKLDESILEQFADSKEDLMNALSFAETNEGARAIYLPGYIYESITKKDDMNSIYKKCVTDMINTWKGLRLALTNRVDVEYHYLVDTFDSEVTFDRTGIATPNVKSEFFTLARDKDNAFAIVNFPKMFKFTKGLTYDMNNMKNHFGKYIPSETAGASFGAYYTQLVFTDGTVKSTIPSAGLVSNLFMNKWSSRQPYYIVAGPNFGRFTEPGLVGPDYNFSRVDLDVMEPMGVNAIIYVPRKGTYINSNQTAKQIPVSGLSKVHIRELVIYLQNMVENLLQSYQWEMNTQTLRDTIKSKADAICENIMNNGGIYAFVNVCDETNNTPEVIDNEMIILDTEIEPARGAGKMVHQLTIHRTGGLSSVVK